MKKAEKTPDVISIARRLEAVARGLRRYQLGDWDHDGAQLRRVKLKEFQLYAHYAIADLGALASKVA